MKEWYNNINDINEALGSDLDIDQAWTRFDNKKKRRRYPFIIPILFGLGSMLLVVLYMMNNNGSTIAADSDIQTDHVQVKEKYSQPIRDAGLNKNSEGTTAATDLVVNAKPGDGENNDASNRKETSDKLGVASRLNQFKSPLIQIRPKHSLSLTKDDRSSYINPDTRGGDHSAMINEPAQVESDILQAEIESNTNRAYAYHNDYEPKEYIGISDSHQPQLRFPQIGYLLGPLHSELTQPGAILNASQFVSLPEQHEPNATWSIDMNHALGLMQRTVKSTDDFDLLREEEEALLESNHLQFVIGRQIGSRLNISTGITFGHYRTKLVNQIQRVSSPTFHENSVIERQTQNGITENIFGTAVGSKTVIIENILYQRYQNVSIPLDLSIGLLRFSGWQFGLGFGLEYSIHQEAKGSTISSIFPTGEYVPIEQLGYRKRGIIEGKYNLRLSRRIGKRFTAHLAFVERRDLNSRIVGMQPKDRFSSRGISLGVRLDL